jgi:hypothetical protein
MALLKLFHAFQGCQNETDISSIDDSETLENIHTLLEKNYIALNNETLIQQTSKGIEAFKGFCETCECTPCDCNWGN